MFQLVAVEGMLEGHVWGIPADEPLLVGRDPSCGIRLQDAEVSRKQCRFQMQGDELVLEDLQSSNCTLVDGVPVTRSTVQKGQRIAVGRCVFIVSSPIDTGELANKPNANETTLRILGEELPLLQDSHETDGATGHPYTVADLAWLVRNGRRLSQAASLDEMVKMVGESLLNRLEPEGVTIVPTHDSRFLGFTPFERGEIVVEPSTSKRHCAEKAIGNSSGASTNIYRDGEPYSTLFARLSSRGASLGYIVVQSRVRVKHYRRSDLEALVAIALIMSPHLHNLAEWNVLQQNSDALRRELAHETRLVGDSPEISHVKKLTNVAAMSHLPVLILGETGTGKEIVARMIHIESPRRNGPYVVVNCAAIPDELFESEMFGHEPGAYTGALRGRRGRFEEAHEGTLFLDEIGDLSQRSQARILRAIELGTFRRVGGGDDITVDARIVSATNKLVTGDERANSFRNDLYHRLSGFEILLPPLRARTGDILNLAQHFFDVASSQAHTPAKAISSDATARLLSWHWPGNVRELRACIERAVAVSRAAEITAADLQLGEIPTSESPNGPLTLAELEATHVQRLLIKNDGNILATSRDLGISRSSLYHKMKTYNL